MTDTEVLVIGDRFTIKADGKPRELWEEDAAGRRLLVRFLPGYSYRATTKTLNMANEMLAAGECIKGGEPPERRFRPGLVVGASRGKVAGSVSVNAKATKKTKTRARTTRKKK